MKRYRSPFDNVTFVALESYSMVGGLQQFNRRVVYALSYLSPHDSLPTIILKGDNPEDLADCADRCRFIACGKSKLRFIKKIFISIWSTRVLYLGHINLLPIAVLARILSPGLKIVLFVHGEDVWDQVGYRRKRALEPFALKFVNRIASVSEYTSKRMSSSYGVPLEKFSIFANAVDPIPPLNINVFSKQSSRILTVARLAAHDFGKNHASVLHAVAQLRPRFPNIFYQVIGDGVLRSDLERLASELGLDDCVEFSGRVTDEELDQAYRAASAFVMPSAKEGFGIVFLEAWQRSLPVICGSEDASHEVITEGVDGFAVHHEDITDLSEKIAILLSDPELAERMGEAGRCKVSKKYMMNNFIQNLRNLHEDLVR